jgi:hypothetical protein
MPVYISQEQIDRVQAELAAKAIQRQPPPANVGLATTLHDDGRVVYRGRAYRTRPVPWRVGIRLQALDFELAQLQLHQPTPRVLLHVRHCVTQMIALLWSCVRAPWWMRLLGVNGFDDAEMEELRALRSFFSTGRTRSTVVLLASGRAPAWLQPTALTDSPSLRVGIRAGWRATASLAASVTTNSASSPSAGKPSAT